MQQGGGAPARFFCPCSGVWEAAAVPLLLALWHFGFDELLLSHEGRSVFSPLYSVLVALHRGGTVAYLVLNFFLPPSSIRYYKPR